MAQFRIDIPERALVDLRERLGPVRWPEAETVMDWSQGVPTAYMRELCDYWRADYDWRRVERQLNQLAQFRIELDGLQIHFVHVRSPHADAMPLLMTHGWPGSIIEFLKVIGPLTDPPAYGGEASDAFHVVSPSLPGYGFSDRPAATGWGVEKIARQWEEPMARLGYELGAQGGDWGGVITMELGARGSPSCSSTSSGPSSGSYATRACTGLPDVADLPDVSPLTGTVRLPSTTQAWASCPVGRLS